MKLTEFDETRSGTLKNLVVDDNTGNSKIHDIDATDLIVGMFVTGTNIPPGTRIQAIDGNSQQNHTVKSSHSSR